MERHQHITDFEERVVMHVNKIMVLGEAVGERHRVIEKRHDENISSSGSLAIL